MDFQTAQEVFGRIVSGTIVSVDSLTVLPLLGGRKNPMLDRVMKRMINAQAMVFGNVQSNAYENMVRRRLTLENKDPSAFKLQERKWGTRIKGTAFVEHNGNFYIEMLFLRSGEVSYLLDNEPILKENIIGFKEVIMSEESQGGLENKVHIRTFKLESLVEVRAFKKAWT